MEDFANRLTALRRARNLTQEEAARLSRLPLESYRQYESGQLEPTLSAIAALARLFGVSGDYLVGLEGMPPTPSHPEKAPLILRLMTPEDPPLYRRPLRPRAGTSPSPSTSAT